MSLVNLLVVLAILQFVAFGWLVGSARARYGVAAPATSGNEHFERYHRVHMNTLELLICLIPGVWIASTYWHPWFVAAMIATYLIGRVIYFRAYIANPRKRSLGFGVSVLPILALLIAGAGGAVWAMVK